MKILAISDVPSKALWDYGTREHLEGIDLILSCGDLPQKYLEYLTNFTAAPILYVHGNHDGSYRACAPVARPPSSMPRSAMCSRSQTLTL